MTVCAPAFWVLLGLLSVTIVVLALGVTDLLCDWYDGARPYQSVMATEDPLNNAVEMTPMPTSGPGRFGRRVHFAGPESLV